MIATVFHWIQFGFLIGPFRLSHWFSWTGSIYVAFAVPIIAVLKKHFPNKYQILTQVHIYGNLTAFLLISVHFAGQISRAAASYPSLGTGLVLYIAMVLLVGTGILQRFHLMQNVKPQTTRLLHIGSAMVFYLTIVIHILHGIGMM